MRKGTINFDKKSPMQIFGDVMCVGIAISIGAGVAMGSDTSISKVSEAKEKIRYDIRQYVKEKKLHYNIRMVII